MMAGYKILRTMEASEAPVYVVVKSFAASMGAVITALADRSFAFPNAIILHHQMWTFSYGNVTEMEEQLEMMREWWSRLATPVAKKMGVSLDEFVDRMYDNSSAGDWEEFADAAKKIKWVDEVVNEIREESETKNPEIYPEKRSPLWPFLPGAREEEVDEEGKPFVRLPRLSPFDFYFIYNPDKYYR